MTLQASVIVNTHNRPDYLDGCLRALAQLSLLASSAGHFRVCRADKRESNQWGAFGNAL